MYDYLTGRVAEIGPDEVVIDIGGVGYRLAVSGTTAGRLPAEGSATLFVRDLVRDERMVLFGFASREERRLFDSLLGVNKVGPTLALGLLSALEPRALAAAVDSGDVTTLSRVKGVGKRTAERLCVELKGRLGLGAANIPGPLGDQRMSVTAALAALGFPRAAAEQAADRVCQGVGAGTPLEELVKRALAGLSGAQAATGQTP